MLLQSEYQVTWHEVRALLTFSFKNNLFMVFHASLYLHLQGFLLVNDMAAMADRAIA